MVEIPDVVVALARRRDEARASKDFARADALRAEIEAAGYRVRDTPSGSVVERALSTPVAPSSIRDVLGGPASLAVSIHLLYEGHLGDLERFLEAFEAHHRPGDMEVVVVDPGSGDPEGIDGAIGARPWARAVSLDRDPGWAASRNAGLRTARGEVIALADLSIEPTGDIVSPLVEVLGDPSVAVAGPFGLVSEDLRSWREAPGPEVDAIEGYLLATRRTLLAGALLDERFRWYRNADIDLSFQLRAAAGGGARVVPLPLRRHEHRGWTSLMSDERERWSKRNFRIFLERWGDRLDLLTGSPPPGEGAS